MSNFLEVERGELCIAIPISKLISLRDFFASQAVPYVCQVAGLEPNAGKTVFESIALDAYAMADAMLAARAKGGTK